MNPKSLSKGITLQTRQISGAIILIAIWTIAVLLFFHYLGYMFGEDVHKHWLSIAALFTGFIALLTDFLRRIQLPGYASIKPSALSALFVEKNDDFKTLPLIEAGSTASDQNSIMADLQSCAEKTNVGPKLHGSPVRQAAGFIILREQYSVNSEVSLCNENLRQKVSARFKINWKTKSYFTTDKNILNRELVEIGWRITSQKYKLEPLSPSSKIEDIDLFMEKLLGRCNLEEQ